MTQPTNLSRRQFLRRSTGWAVAGLAAPYIIPSGVLAFQGRPGANDRIGIGGIGIGRQGSGVLHNAVELQGRAASSASPT